MKRVTVIVMDSLGVGELPDAANYGDKGTNTFTHIADNVPELAIPNLADWASATSRVRQAADLPSTNRQVLTAE